MDIELCNTNLEQISNICVRPIYYIITFFQYLRFQIVNRKADKHTPIDNTTWNFKPDKHVYILENPAYHIYQHNRSNER
jgi:hypothetical protein